MKHTAHKTLDKINAIWDTRMQELVSGFTFLCSLVLLGYVCEKLHYHNHIKNHNVIYQLKYKIEMHNWSVGVTNILPMIKIQDFGGKKI